MKTSRKNSKQRSRQYRKYAKRLAAYSAAAAATVLTTGDRTANANDPGSEVVWNIPDVTVRNSGPGQDRGIVFDMVTGGTELNRPLGGPDPNGTLPNFPGYWPSRGKFRLTASWGGYIYMPSYTPDPEGTYPPGPDPNAEFYGMSLPYERPAGTWDPSIPGPDKNKMVGVPIGSMGFPSSRWNIGFLGSGFNAYSYYAGSQIGVTGQNFVMDGDYRGQSYYALVDFPLGARGFVGIHFKLDDDADPNTQRVSYFGWAEITKFRIGGGDFEFILHGFGYQSHQGTRTISVETNDTLTLEVHASGEFAGHIFITNNSIGDVEFDYYQIHSPSGGGANRTLDPNGWVSLAEQDYEGSGISDIVADSKNDGLDFLEWQRSSQDPDLLAAIQDQYGLVPPNTGWEVLGDPTNIVVAEGRAQGSTIIKLGDSIDLGLLYDTNKDAFPGNGFFQYLAPGGRLVEGSIVRIDPMAASAAVPEPNSIMLLAAGAAGLGMWRKRRAG